tara:strand:+ start:3910 stop:7356 length:3447 start_codon:yes stop_codon:yes gene_type:complete
MDSKLFGKYIKKKKLVPMIDIRYVIKRELKCFKGYKKYKKNRETLKTIAEEYLTINKKDTIEIILNKMNEWNKKMCPVGVHRMKRPELSKLAETYNLDIGESIRGKAPRRTSGNTFKPLLQLTGIKKYYNTKEQKAFEEEQKKNKSDPFDILIKNKDKDGNIIEGFTTLTLRKQQKLFIEKMIYSNNSGAIAFWSVGTGKTVLSVVTIKAYLRYYPNGNVIFIAPSALLSNLMEKLFLFGIDIRDNRIKYYSYERYAKIKTSCLNTLMIIDEAHNMRTPITYKKGTDKLQSGGRPNAILTHCSNIASKILLLTATPLVNGAYDLENLLAMIDGRPPLNQTNFFDTITQEKPAQDLLSYRVSHFKRTFDDKDFPARKDHFLKVFMNEDEEKFYDNVRTDPSLKVKSFYIGVRTLINKLGKPPPPSKIKMVADMIKDQPKSRNIIYMTFIKDGIDQFSKALEKLNIEFLVVSGQEGAVEKQKAVEFYNTGKIRVIIISKAGAEGLDLKRTNNMFLMDQFWNEATREQVIGRGIRYKSHEGIKDPVVNVYNVFFMRKKEVPFLEKISKITDDKMFNLILNTLKAKLTEEKKKKAKKGKGLGYKEGGIIFMTQEDRQKAKKMGITAKEYYEKISFNKYAQQQVLGTKLDPPTNLTIDLYLYIYSKSKQYTINQFEKFLLDLPQFEDGISEAERKIMSKMKDLGGNVSKEERLNVYQSVLTSYISDAGKILKSNNLTSKNVLQKLTQQKNRTVKQKAKMVNAIKQQYFTNDDQINIMYELSDIEKDKRELINMLEPTAGIGNIINYFFKRHPNLQIRATEIEEDNRKILLEYMKKAGMSVENLYKTPDFLRLVPDDDFNYILMNPPFNLRKNVNPQYKVNVYDIDFIKRAYAFLKNGGVLVALMYARHYPRQGKRPTGRLGELFDWLKSKVSKSVYGTIKWKGSEIQLEKQKGQVINRLSIVYVKIIKNEPEAELGNINNKLISETNNLFVDSVKSEPKPELNGKPPYNNVKFKIIKKKELFNVKYFMDLAEKYIKVTNEIKLIGNTATRAKKYFNKKMNTYTKETWKSFSLDKKKKILTEITKKIFEEMNEIIIKVNNLKKPPQEELQKIINGDNKALKEAVQIWGKTTMDFNRFSNKTKENIYKQAKNYID